MRKIPIEYENPIDNIILYIIQIIAPFFYFLGFTPNILTTISLLIAIASIYYFMNDRYYLSAGLIFLAYFFDCFDGFFARSYNMTSVFGDFYDHISDAYKFIFLLIAMYLKNYDKFKKVVCVFIFFGLLGFIHMGQQEKYYNKNSSLDLLKMFSINNDHNIMEYTRYLGCGTMILIKVLGILYYDIK